MSAPTHDSALSTQHSGRGTAGAVPRTALKAPSLVDIPEITESPFELSAGKDVLPVVMVVLIVGAIATAIGYATDTLLATAALANNPAFHRQYELVQTIGSTEIYRRME
ncbi:MAG: hypothetical protein KGJ86_22415 [Chloroflexota bacterium]|nr:hypothetical protein [Chloroflexota bacterium]